ncbi:mechanosensitive ion channel family protein [Aliishimia ponticola]|uniref:Mechanosensitive ion channel family protein n=1 Tax=Aliishimia ponticola TaxID=2499833 RepID=A0A4S4NAQ2_9RHOB|nr:mechanosensitive ion channel family protein [Aliishimia ponticola]THH35108.1 mechanosensitive ion channel family protein [Aliishimia ponticola]
MIFRYLRAAVLCVFAVAMALSVVPASGQSLVPTTEDATETTSGSLAQVIEEAAKNGAQVIVVDSSGNLLPSTAELAGQEATEDAAQSESVRDEINSDLRRAQMKVNDFRATLVERVASLPTALNEVRFILMASSPDGTIAAFGKVLFFSLLLFAVGMVAERFIYGPYIARPFIVPLIKENPRGYSEKIPFLVMRFIGGVIGVLFSMVVAYVLGYVFIGPIDDSAVEYTVTLINIGYFSARVIAGLWRMILSPFLSQYRIPRLTDREALRLHLWLSAVFIMGVIIALFGQWIMELGLNQDVHVFIAAVLSLVILLVNFAMIPVNKGAITRAILNRRDPKDVSWPARLVASSWAPAAVLFLVYATARRIYDLVVGNPEGMPLAPAAYLVLTVIIVVYGVINYGIERGFARARAMREMNAVGQDGTLSEADAIGGERPHRQMETFEDLARRVAAILAFVAGFIAFLNLWQAGSEMMGESLPERTVDVIVIMFFGYVIFHAFRIWIDGKIREEIGEEVPAELGDEGGGSSASRLATLLPLFRNLILIVIVVTILLIVLMEMGVNVGPLFAGAGIVGVAVGFGSQTLVRDIFSGAFFLFDDAFRKGEYIEIGDVRGTVEKISVRSFQLRHHLGKLHTIPFGEIQVLTNYSRDWVMMKLPLRVTYDTDVEKVRKLVKKLGQQLLEDPEIGEDFIQPLKSQGVIEMQDSAMIIRVKFMTKPGDQWVIRKRVFQEIRDLFEREGIKFAHREVTVRLADEGAQNLSEKQKEAVSAAAQAAIEAEDIDDLPDTGDDR